MREFKNLVATVYVLAQSATNRRQLKLVLKESYRLDLPVNGEHEHKTGYVNLRFDDNYVAQFGYKWKGYLYDLKDASGKILFTDFSPRTLDKNLDRIRELALNKELVLFR